MNLREQVVKLRELACADMVKGSEHAQGRVAALGVVLELLDAQASDPAEPDGCDGATSARWCPVHGTCTCPRDAEGGWAVSYSPLGTAAEVQHDPACPLHGPASTHGGDAPEPIEPSALSDLLSLVMDGRHPTPEQAAAWTPEALIASDHVDVERLPRPAFLAGPAGRADDNPDPFDRAMDGGCLDVEGNRGGDDEP